LRPLLEDRGHITESVRVLVPVDRMKQKCVQIMTKKLCMNNVQIFLLPLIVVRPDDADATISVDCLKISFSQELQLVLYRHWTLYDSLCHTEYTACKFCVWTSNGRRLLREFLACMGLVCVLYIYSRNELMILHRIDEVHFSDT